MMTSHSAIRPAIEVRTSFSDMPQRDYRAYALSPNGKAARARAHARYVAKRRALNQSQPKASTTQVAGLLSSWGRNDRTHTI